MACPYFEPLAVLPRGAAGGARLPLIEAYQGRCHSGAAAGDVTLEACNRGYAGGQCARYPAGAANRALRYSLAARAPDALDVLCIVEEGYSPVSQQRLRFSVPHDRLLNEPGQLDGKADCRAAQAAAFCRSYLRRLAENGSGVFES